MCLKRTGFVVQFGLASSPALTEKWDTEIPDDPVVQSNLYSYVSFATSGANSRSTQIFININDNPRLDSSGFSPFARVVSGMDVVEKLYNPTPTSNMGLDQTKIRNLGNDWILAEYPDVDIITSTTATDNVANSHSAAAVPILAAWIVLAAVLATVLVGAGLC
jgi:peptidyl-prolyl cis-trans isomerase A (cyclophilin A)